jgi:DNA-directed RNA polymerase subunit RPC12/RpoP
MISSISLRCPSCEARIKAPLQLIGQWRSCPGCGTRFVVRPQVADEEHPVLVGDDRPGSFGYGADRH